MVQHKLAHLIVGVE